MNEEDSLEIIERFREIYGDDLILIDELDEITLNKLINAGIISSDSKNKEAVIGLIFSNDHVIVINDSDHISINITNFGEEIKLAYDRAMEIEENLDKKFDFAFSPQYGYLTSFGRNSGNGIEIRLKMFLFGLLDNTQAYLTLKSSLAHDGIYITRFVPEYFKSYDDDIYMKKYNVLGFSTKLSNQEIDYLIFNITKNKFKGNRDEERYEFFNSYMEAR